MKLNQEPILPVSAIIEYIDITIKDDGTEVRLANNETWVSGNSLMQFINGANVQIKSELDEEANLRNTGDKHIRVRGSVWVNDVYVYFVDTNQDIQRAKFNNINPKFLPHESITLIKKRRMLNDTNR
jgi:hypothetical protein